MRRWSLVVGGLVLGGALLSACGDDDDGPSDGGPPDASTSTGGRSGGSGGRSGSGGQTGSGGRGSGGSGGSSGAGGTVAPMPTVCGGTTCPDLGAQGAAFGLMGCCTPDNACGVQTPLSPGNCLPQNAPGGIDSSCPSLDVMGGVLTLGGCCTPAGKCGALGTTFGAGCIPNSSLMGVDQNCTYDATNTCNRFLDVACDGAEDCGSGQKCCAHYEGAYTKFVCAADCAAEMAAQGGTWSEACHPGETCTTANYSCFENPMLLPDYLFRCRDTGAPPVKTNGSTAAGEVNCGGAVCGDTQKCCIAFKGADLPNGGTPTCVPEAQPCRCSYPTPDDGGSDDGGS